MQVNKFNYNDGQSKTQAGDKHSGGGGEAGTRWRSGGGAVKSVKRNPGTVEHPDDTRN